MTAVADKFPDQDKLLKWITKEQAQVDAAEQALTTIAGKLKKLSVFAGTDTKNEHGNVLEGKSINEVLAELRVTVWAKGESDDRTKRLEILKNFIDSTTAGKAAWDSKLDDSGVNAATAAAAAIAATTATTTTDDVVGGGRKKRRSRKRTSKSSKRKSRKRRSRKVSRRRSRKKSSKSSKRKSRKRRSRKVSRRRSRKNGSKSKKSKSRRRRKSKK